MNLNDTLHGYDRSLAKVPSDMPGEIGAVIKGKRRTNVVGRGGFVYVRLRTNLSEPIQAYNDKVFPGFGVAVIVRWVNNRYEIIGRDSQRYQEWETDTPEITKHGSSHSLDVEGNNIGTDPVWVYPYQVLPGLVSPYSQSGAQNVYVHPFPILYGGEWMYVGNTGTPSLTVYSPTSGTVLVLIAMDAETGNPALFASTGSYISWNISGSNSLVPNLPYLDTVRYLPLAFAALQSGTTSMSWSNLRDLRQWISVRSTGTTFDLAANIHSAVSDLSFHDDDEFPKSDSQDSWGLKNFTWANVKTALNALYAALPHTHAASEITSGTMATARLGSGTANGTTFLSGDQTYKQPLVPYTSTNDIFRCDSPGGASAFAGTIATLPGGATLTYNVTSGYEGAMVPYSTSHLAKMRLYNTTRGDYALINNCVTGTNTITLTANVPVSWVVGDVITILSTTLTTSGGLNWVDLEMTDSTLLGRSAIACMMAHRTATAVEDTFNIHPTETFGSGKIVANKAQVLNVANWVGVPLLAINSNLISLTWASSPTYVFLRVSGYLQ